MTNVQLSTARGPMGAAYAGTLSGSITVVRFAPAVGHDVSIDRSVLPRV